MINIYKLHYIFLDNLNEHIEYNASKNEVIESYYGFLRKNLSIESSLDVREVIKENLLRPELMLSSNKDDFDKFIYETLLRFETEPSAEIASLENTRSQLQTEILSRISLYNSEIEHLNSKINESDDEIDYIDSDIIEKKKKFLNYHAQHEAKLDKIMSTKPTLKLEIKRREYYINKLNLELSNILSFDFHTKSIRNSQKYGKESEYNQYFSDYQWFKSMFEITDHLPIYVKFYKYSETVKDSLSTLDIDMISEERVSLDYPYTFKNMVELWSNHRNEYRLAIKNYISEDCVLDYIDNAVSKSHILNRRKNVIQHLLKLFKQEEYEIFVAIIGTEIEGLFYDLLDAYEAIPSDISSFSLTPKIKNIDDRIYFDSSPYFIADFQYIRNKVAHGVTHSIKDLENVANDLLLDLQYLVYLISSDPQMPYYGFVTLIKKTKAIENSSKIEIASLLYSYLMSNDLDLSLQFLLNERHKETVEFYCNYELIDQLRSILLSETFHNLVLSKVNVNKHTMNNVRDEVVFWRDYVNKITIYLQHSELGDVVLKRHFKFAKLVKKSYKDISLHNTAVSRHSPSGDEV